MNLPAHIQAALGIGTPATDEQLYDAVGGWPVSRSAFGLSSEDFCAAASEADSGVEIIDLSPLKRMPDNWNYLELILDGSREGFGVQTPKPGLGVPPTQTGQALVKGWFADSSIVVDDTAIHEGLLLRGMASVPKHRDFSRRLIETWADVYPLLEGSNVPPPWVTQNQIIMFRGSRILSAESPGLRYENLFIEAVSEVKAKWRYLSLYRIL
ncbi:MAG: hypothetical protein V7641_3097 [Blastocatellia bacterium]